MARIPTYTAEGGIPAGGTGPQASAAAFAAPARALGGLGETIAQTGEQVSRGMFKLAEIKQQRQEQDDAFWAANQATNLHRELMRIYREGKGKEDQPETFLADAESRLSQLESTAPNPNAAKRLRLAIDGSINSIYGQALDLSYHIKEQNRISEFEVNAQNIGQPINSSDDFTRPLALMTAQSMIGQQLQLINSLPYSEASKRKIRGAFIEELALNVSTNAPEFALNLINTTDLDESRKSTLRKQIDSYVEFNNSAAIYNYENGPNGKLNEIKSIYNTGVPIKPPSDAELMSVYGKDRWQLKRAQFDELYRVANTVVDEFNKVRDLPYDRQFAAVAPKLSPKDPEVSEKLREMLEKSKEEQEKRIHTWMTQNNSQVRDAFAVAYSAPEKDRPAKLTAARALSLKYQGSPEDENDPNASKYHRLPARLQQVMTQSEAEEHTKKMNALGDDALAQYITRLAIEYPDDDQRAIAYNNLVTLPKNGISPDIQFSQMITDPQRRVNILGVMRNQAYVRAFTQEEDNDFVEALNGNEKWEPFHKNIDPTFNPQRPEIKGFYDAVISYAKRISVKENIKASKAVEMAVNDLISHDDETSGPWYFTDSINGQQLAIQAARDDLGLKPSRTASEVKAIGEKLRFAIKQIPIDKVAIKNPNGTSIFPGADLIIDEAEKQKFIQTAIRSQSVWITNPNGQGAQLYLNGRDFGRFPLKDRNGKIFEVDYDEIARAPLDPFAETSVQGPVIPYGEGQMDNVYMQFRRQYPVSINLPATAISPMEIDAVGSEFMLNIMSQYWKNLKFSKTTK